MRDGLIFAFDEHEPPQQVGMFHGRVEEARLIPDFVASDLLRPQARHPSRIVGV